MHFCALHLYRSAGIYRIPSRLFLFKEYVCHNHVVSFSGRLAQRPRRPSFRLGFSDGASEHGIELWVFVKGGEFFFFTSLVVITLSRNTPHHAVSCLVRVWKKFKSWTPKMPHASGECH